MHLLIVSIGFPILTILYLSLVYMALSSILRGRVAACHVLWVSAIELRLLSCVDAKASS